MEEPAGRKSKNHGMGAAARLSGLVGGLDYSINPDDADRWLAPDILTAAQWRASGGLCECGCHRLMLALLLDCFDRLQTPVPGQRAMFERTRQEALAR